MSSDIRVVLVDDQSLVRTGLSMVIDTADGMRVVGEAADGSEALDVVGRTQCDLVLMDVRMPIMDGVTATRELVRRHPDRPRIVVLTTFDLDEYAFEALRAGASGFLLKDAPAEEVLAAIRTVHGGDAVIAPSTTRRLLDHVAADLPNAVTHDDRISALTDRERDVMVAIAQGATNSEIAASLYLAEATVKTHVGRILSKLGLRDRVQIVIHACETGLVRRGRR
jgi:DNA-binding NarL/FixJ family response regulator